MKQAPYSSVYDAASVRLAEFGQHLLELEADDLPDDLPVGQLLDLYQGLETAAGLRAGADQDGIDPFRRAQLPAVPPTGATVRRLVLGVNGRAARVNGKLVGVGAELVPITGPPEFNTTLLPGQTIEALTYNGDPDSTFSFNMPMAASTGGPQQMLLYVDGGQVGRVDFPLTVEGNYFRLIRAGISYLGTFQVVAAPYHVTLSVE
jgi:hypothetical protein